VIRIAIAAIVLLSLAYAGFTQFESSDSATGATQGDTASQETHPFIPPAGQSGPRLAGLPARQDEPDSINISPAETVATVTVVDLVSADVAASSEPASEQAAAAAAKGVIDGEAVPLTADKAAVAAGTVRGVAEMLPVGAGPLDNVDKSIATATPDNVPGQAAREQETATDTDSSVYTDQLIDPSALEADSLYPGFADAQEPQGFRSYSTEYRHYQQDIDRAGKSYEDGFIFHARRETRDYGEFELLATIRNDRPSNDSADDDTTGGRLTLRQYGFALNENWLLDNSAGVLRSDSDQVLSNSYRFNLPSTLVSGLKNWSRNEHTQLRFSAGKIGTLGTGRIEDFDTTSGSLASMNVSHALTDRWLMSGQVIALNDSDEVQDHETGAVALQYRSDDRRHTYVGHALTGSDGGDAVWLDGDNQFGRWRQRYGVFWLEPDLLWSDASLTDDQQGIYTRSELRSQRYNLTVGTDFNENNIKDNNALPKNRFSNLFITGNRRLQRTTSVGGTASYLGIDPRNAAAGDESRVIRLTGYVQQRFGIGDTRLEITAADIEKNNDNGNVYGVTWDQSWNVHRWLTLSTTLAHEQSRGLSDDEKRDSASVLFTHNVTPEFQWNGSASYAHVKTDGDPGRDNYNVVLGSAWQFLPNWVAHLDLTWSRAEENTGVLDELFDVDEKTLLLRIKHSLRSGRPFMTAGNKTGSSGYGEVSGEVFYDDNRDGMRQAGERAASGIFVYLDNRYERVTDNEGRYSFSAVQAGEHEVSIAVEDLPLPWGLEDDGPQAVTVKVRAVAEVNFALTRIIQ
jgi:hypothetical protein